jgi:hypothetical protein
MKLIDWIINRAKEPSTFSGISSALALTGIVVDPELYGQIGAAVIALVSIFEIVRREKK